jgi:hypothetical protein
MNREGSPEARIHLTIEVWKLTLNEIQIFVSGSGWYTIAHKQESF